MEPEAPKRVVYRYRISPHREMQQLLLPDNAQVLQVAIKPGDEWISLWALCRAGPVNEVPRRFWCVGTGWNVLPGAQRMEYVGTAIETDSATVWHVFEELTASELT